MMCVCVCCEGRLFVCFFVRVFVCIPLNTPECVFCLKTIHCRENLGQEAGMCEFVCLCVCECVRVCVCVSTEREHKHH